MQTKILYWAPVASSLYDRTYNYLNTHGIKWYLAIFMVGKNNPSAVYVRKKIAYAEELGLAGRLFHYDQWDLFDNDVVWNREISSNDNIIDANWSRKMFEKIIHDIEICNNDLSCLWIIIQLPLPNTLLWYKKQLLDAVLPEKDVDCLGERLLTLSQIGNNQLQVAPATPAAALHLLDYYYRENNNPTDITTDGTTILFDASTGYCIKPCNVAVLWESNLIWKPLIELLKQRGAIVQSFNEFSDQNQMRSICKTVDIIIAATGQLHLVDENFVRNDNTQIVIDIGRWFLDGKATGDVNLDLVANKIAAYTPVPWGVWPVTVASIFWNMCLLHDWKRR